MIGFLGLWTIKKSGKLLSNLFITKSVVSPHFYVKYPSLSKFKICQFCFEVWHLTIKISHKQHTKLSQCTWMIGIAHSGLHGWCRTQRSKFRWAGQNHHLTFKTHPFYCSVHLKELLKWSWPHQLELLTRQNERVWTTSLLSWIDSLKGENWVFCCFHIIIIQYKHSFYIHTLYLQCIMLYLSLQSHISLCLYTLHSFHPLFSFCFVLFV